MNKTVSYRAHNTYETLSELHSNTKQTWLVCHGIGYLSGSFGRLFQPLDLERNYIIVPQAPAKYYKDSAYQKVGASWLTRENTEIDIQSILNYLDAVRESEKEAFQKDLILLGYSQGVSVVARWMARHQIACKAVVFISGGFPKEVDADAMKAYQETPIYHIVGKNDPYFRDQDIDTERQRLTQIFPKFHEIWHDGGHELQTESFKFLA